MFILQALYFFLPAYIANMAPVFAAKIMPNLDTPMDFGMTWKGKPLLGSHKTWRGLAAGVVAAIFTVYLQTYLLRFDFFASLSIVDYELRNLIVFGALFGLGALVGDAVKSFFKRRIGLESGSKWLLFDQLDFVIGGLIFISFVYQPTLEHVLVILLLSPLLHVGVNIVGFWLGLKKVPW